jgi:hypothetical protein
VIVTLVYDEYIYTKKTVNGSRVPATHKGCNWKGGAKGLESVGKIKKREKTGPKGESGQI